MIHFERTADYNLVRLIVTHPKVWAWSSDDLSVSPDQWRPIASPAIWYILAGDGPKLLGLWILTPLNGICAEVHTCLLPGHGFRRAREAARALAPWVWEHASFERVITNVPAFNQVALAFARDAGLEQFGLNPKSFLKHGSLWDQTLLGISRPAKR